MECAGERGRRGSVDIEGADVGSPALVGAAWCGAAAGRPGADGVKCPRPRAEPGCQGNGSASSGGAGAYH